jgi:type I restriction enzyme S subunit
MELVELNRIIDKMESGSREKGGSVTSGIISIGGTHLSTRGGFKWDKKEFISEEFYSMMRSGKVQKNDILVVKDGATTGKTSFVGEDFPFNDAAINEHVFRLQINTEQANPKYVFYFLFSPNGQKQILNDFRGATVGGISRGFVNLVKIPLPDLETQNKIVAILDKAKAIMDKREKNISMYDNLLRATFLEMFGDVASNPKGFEKVQISHFGTIITGNTPPRNEDVNYSSKFIEWIKTDNITSKSHVLTTASEYLSEIGFAKARHVPANSLLVACIAGSIESIGRSAISDRKVAFNQQINAIVPHEGVSVYFLYWMFRVSSKYIQSFATGGMKKLLTKGEFEKILILRPPQEKQFAFESIAKKYSKLATKLQYFEVESQNLLSSFSSQFFNEENTVDHDRTLELLFNTIDLNRNDEENDIGTLINDPSLIRRLITFLNEQKFENKDQYDKGKYILFRIMNEDMVTQVFKNEKVELILK